MSEEISWPGANETLHVTGPQPQTNGKTNGLLLTLHINLHTRICKDASSERQNIDRDTGCPKNQVVATLKRDLTKSTDGRKRKGLSA